MVNFSDHKNHATFMFSIKLATKNGISYINMDDYEYFNFIPYVTMTYSSVVK